MLLLSNLPQSRVRLYLVGIWHERYVHPFHWPKALDTNAVRLVDVMDKDVAWKPGQSIVSQLPEQLTARNRIIEALHEAVVQGVNPMQESIVVDSGASEKYAHWTRGSLPTITASRGGNPLGFWESTRGRCLKVSELCRAQGFHESHVDWLSAGVTRCQFGKMIGNGMAINILELVIPRLLHSAGFLDALPCSADSWLVCQPGTLPL